MGRAGHDREGVLLIRDGSAIARNRAEAPLGSGTIDRLEATEPVPRRQN